MAAVGAAPVYDQDLQQLSVASMDTTGLLAGYLPEVIPAQPFQPPTLNGTYMVKAEQLEDLTNDMQVVPEESYMSMGGMAMDPGHPVSILQQPISPTYPPEIVPPGSFASLAPSDPSLSMELSPLALSTPSPPTIPNGFSTLGQQQAATFSQTSSSLDSALVPSASLASSGHSANSMSPVSANSPYASSSSQSPPAQILAPEHPPNQELPLAQKTAYNQMIDTLVNTLAVARDAVNGNGGIEEFKSTMAVISRMVNEVTLTDPPLGATLGSAMSGIADFNTYPSHPPPSMEMLPPLPISDQSRKRPVSAIEASPAIAALKHEPPEEAPLLLPTSMDPLGAISQTAIFPATSAIPLSAQAPSRPGTRPPTPQSAFSSSPSFLPSISSYPVGAAPLVMGQSVGSLGTPAIPSNPSFASVRPGWPDQPVPASRHHHSLSAGSIINPVAPMQLTMPPIPTLHPGLASGPSTPSTVNPPPLNRTSRSGSLTNVYEPFNFANYSLDTMAEPPLKRAALGNRTARNSAIGSNWYLGDPNDGSSPSNTSEEPVTARNTPSDDEDSDSSSDSEENHHRSANGNGHLSSSDSPPAPSSSTASDIPAEHRADVDRLFFAFLNRICSDLNAKDSKGDHIHQTLMAKKMQRLDESPDFRPFKFRIQAFTSAFLEDLANNGFPEDKIPMKKVRNYLWHQPHILRFNEDGKKAKSKGNHIWNVEARKLGESKWEFRPFHRKLAGSPPPIAYCGLKWTWTPRIWDPQASFANVPVTYSSPNLPSWLSWKDDSLSGTPPADADSCSITVIAKYTLDGVEGTLSRTLPITIAPVSSVESNAYPRSRRPSVNETPPRRSTSDSALFQAPQRSKGRSAVPPVPIPGETPSNRVVRVLQSVAQRVDQEETELSQFTSPAQTPMVEMAKSKLVLQQTVDAMDKELAGHSQSPETKRLAIAAQQVVLQAAANVIADRNVAIGRAPVVANKSTAVQRVSVNELSDATHDAIVQAVKTNGPASTEVDIFVTAASILKAQAPMAEPHPPTTAIARPPSHHGYIQNLSPLPEYT